MSELERKDRAFIWHPFTQHQTEGPPIVITGAKGSILYGKDGREYIDANSSWWVNVHGHGNEHIRNCITEQFTRIDHVVFAGLTHPTAIELSERILKLLPDNFGKVFFSDDGSTSVEVALKMAFQFWYNKGTERKRILAMEGAYHGDTFGAMSVGQRGYFNRPFEHLFFDVDFLEFPDGDNGSRILEKAEQFFATGEFAALIVEPLVQGAAGMRMYPVSFLDQLVDCAKKNDVLVIFDEVMTGFGRTGKLFAMDHCAMKPDIVTLSKGISGGVLPLGLTVAGNDLYEAFLADDKSKALLHGHSFTGNPLSCAAAGASLDLFEHESTWAGIERICRWNLDFLEELKDTRKVKNVRVCGTILAFEIETSDAEGYFDGVRESAYQYFIDNGVLIRPLGSSIFINPPYCLTEIEYSHIKAVINGFLGTL